MRRPEMKRQRKTKPQMPNLVENRLSTPTASAVPSYRRISVHFAMLADAFSFLLAYFRPQKYFWYSVFLSRFVRRADQLCAHTHTHVNECKML